SDILRNNDLTSGYLSSELNSLTGQILGLKTNPMISDILRSNDLTGGFLNSELKSFNNQLVNSNLKLLTKELKEINKLKLKIVDLQSTVEIEKEIVKEKFIPLTNEAAEYEKKIINRKKNKESEIIFESYKLIIIQLYLLIYSFIEKRKELFIGKKIDFKKYKTRKESNYKCGVKEKIEVYKSLNGKVKKDTIDGKMVVLKVDKNKEKIKICYKEGEEMLEGWAESKYFKSVDENKMIEDLE
ncbi:hypothetical protein, partial [Cetobacterium sp. ZOR0034]|uniref:hypothetical protein n=1 Tax=Cetobacterium sp. ZOR0034 TaxID=1339239 RepID=UPI000647E200